MWHQREQIFADGYEAMTRADLLEDAAIHHSVIVLAAAFMLSRWYQQGARSLVLKDGRVDTSNAPPEPGTWAIDADGARLLAATIAAGERYNGFEDAVKAAKEEIGQEA